MVLWIYSFHTLCHEEDLKWTKIGRKSFENSVHIGMTNIQFGRVSTKHLELKIFRHSLVVSRVPIGIAEPKLVCSYLFGSHKTNKEKKRKL